MARQREWGADMARQRGRHGETERQWDGLKWAILCGMSALADFLHVKSALEACFVDRYCCQRSIERHSQVSMSWGLIQSVAGGVIRWITKCYLYFAALVCWIRGGHSGFIHRYLFGNRNSPEQGSFFHNYWKSQWPHLRYLQQWCPATLWRPAYTQPLEPVSQNSCWSIHGNCCCCCYHPSDHSTNSWLMLMHISVQ